MGRLVLVSNHVPAMRERAPLAGGLGVLAISGESAGVRRWLGRLARTEGEAWVA